MKILDYTLRLSPLAVEKIEDYYDKSIEEVFDGRKMRSKDEMFMLWASVQEEVDIDEFKKRVSGEFTYTQLISKLNDLISGEGKNEQSGTEDA